MGLEVCVSIFNGLPRAKYSRNDFALKDGRKRPLQSFFVILPFRSPRESGFLFQRPPGDVIWYLIFFFPWLRPLSRQSPRLGPPLSPFGRPRFLVQHCCSLRRTLAIVCFLCPHLLLHCIFTFFTTAIEPGMGLPLPQTPLFDKLAPFFLVFQHPKL